MKKSYLLRGCMKLNDNSVFQNGSLGERTSLLTSLLRWSFFARSLWLLMAAPMAPEILKMVKILSKSWVTSNFLQLKIKFLQQKHIFIFHTDRVHPSFISGLEVSRFVISWLFFIALFCTLCWSGTYWLSLMTVLLICLTQSHSVSLSELAQGERPNISLKLVSSFRLLLALLGPSLPPGLVACRAVAWKQQNFNQHHQVRWGFSSNWGEEN